MQVAYFVNSGSEANDMAMLMARLYTGNYDMLALRNCYHGMSEGTMGVTAHNTWKFSVPQVCGPSSLGVVRGGRQDACEMSVTYMIWPHARPHNVLTPDSPVVMSLSYGVRRMRRDVSDT